MVVMEVEGGICSLMVMVEIEFNGGDDFCLMMVMILLLLFNEGGYEFVIENVKWWIKVW
jgi:hypothetical protein